MLTNTDDTIERPIQYCIFWWRVSQEMAPGVRPGTPLQVRIAGVSEQRLWRLRKLHQSVDAELRQAEAAAKRAELERDGWTFHW